MQVVFKGVSQLFMSESLPSQRVQRLIALGNPIVSREDKHISNSPRWLCEYPFNRLTLYGDQIFNA